MRAPPAPRRPFFALPALAALVAAMAAAPSVGAQTPAPSDKSKPADEGKPRRITAGADDKVTDEIDAWCQDYECIVPMVWIQGTIVRDRPPAQAPGKTPPAKTPPASPSSDEEPKSDTAPDLSAKPVWSKNGWKLTGLDPADERPVLVLAIHRGDKTPSGQEAVRYAERLFQIDRLETDMLVRHATLFRCIGLDTTGIPDRILSSWNCTNDEPRIVILTPEGKPVAYQATRTTMHPGPVIDALETALRTHFKKYYDDILVKRSAVDVAYVEGARAFERGDLKTARKKLFEVIHNRVGSARVPDAIRKLDAVNRKEKSLLKDAGKKDESDRRYGGY